VYPQGKQSQRSRPYFSFLIPQIYNRRALANIQNKKWTTTKKHTPPAQATQEKSAKIRSGAAVRIVTDFAKIVSKMNISEHCRFLGNYCAGRRSE